MPSGPVSVFATHVGGKEPKEIPFDRTVACPDSSGLWFWPKSVACPLSSTVVVGRDNLNPWSANYGEMAESTLGSPLAELIQV
jgi:hypothetical protein